MKNNYIYPFSAIVGQELLKKALIINLVNPKVGGVLLSGEKGTGKSTIVRSMKKLVDNMEIVEVPLNTTMDRLVGSIDLEKAIVEGRRVIGDSILMRADGNILYIDEVNLLKEDIINSLLEVSQSKINHVEREGISFTYESSFILIGTMNPEEGQIRAQLLDRFGLYVKIRGEEELSKRVEIIKRRIEYEDSPNLFIKKWEGEDNKLKKKIKGAKDIIKNVELPEEVIEHASELSMKGNCSGHRAELVMIEGAKAIAALDGRMITTIEDLYEAATLTLPHRLRENTSKPKESNKDDEKNNKRRDEWEDKETGSTENQNDKEKDLDKGTGNDFQNEDKSSSISNYDEDLIDKIGEIFKVRNLAIKPLDRKNRKGSGRRSTVKTSEIQGQYSRTIISKGETMDIAFDATLRAAAPYQGYRDKKGLALSIEKSDIREKVREKRTGSTILFAVDASGSMGAKKRMEAVKGAIISLLTDAYEKRDSVGMLGFRKNKAEIILNITRSVDLAYKRLRDLPTGGKTPLSLGLYKSYEILTAAMKKDPDIIPVMVLISDGRGNVSISNKNDPLEEALEISNHIFMEGIQSIVIDTEMDFIKLHRSKDIAKALGASYYSLNELRADEILSAIRQNII